MLPDMAEAITTSTASRLVVLNLAAQQGETEGFSPEQHLDVLSAHAPNLRVDSVLADRASVALPQRLASAATRLGAQLDLHDVAVPGTARHDPSKLSVSLAAVLERAVLEKTVRENTVLENASADGHPVPVLGESQQ
jgi:2-phospho-L-lactate transferase/gluconeogenesis factor (CofD/UPF0052 family)